MKHNSSSICYHMNATAHVTEKLKLIYSTFKRGVALAQI